VDERQNEVRILAIASGPMRTAIARQLEPLNPSIRCVTKPAEIAHLVSEGDVFEVAIFPAALADSEWWAFWGELSLLNPRPAILVYARATSFELWSSVLDLGGYDVIVEPFSDREIQDAVRRAALSFRGRLENHAPQS